MDLVFSEASKEEDSVECKDMFWNMIEKILKEKREEVKKVRTEFKVPTKVPKGVFVIDVNKEEPVRHMKVEDKAVEEAKAVKEENKVTQAAVEGVKEDQEKEVKELKEVEHKEELEIRKETRDKEEVEHKIENKEEAKDKEEADHKEEVEQKKEKEKKDNADEEDIDKLLSRIEDEVNS